MAAADADNSMDVDKVAPDGGDLSGDGGVVKKILEKGEGWQCPEDGDEVTMHYSGRLQDGTVFDSSVQRGDPFKFRVGQGSVIKGWDIVAKTMNKGEKAEVTLTPQYAYGEHGSPPKIPPNSTLVFAMELIGWVSQRDVFGDGGVLKESQADGEGWERPGDKAEVTVNVQAKDVAKDAVLFEGARTFTVGAGDAPKAWDKIVRDMKKGGKVSLICTGEYTTGPGVDFVPQGVDKVLYDLELVSWLKVEDVTSDGGIMKKIMVEGDGWERPNEGSVVVIDGTMAAVRDGQTLPPFKTYSAYSFKVTDGDVVDGLDRLVQSMKKGEDAVATVTPVYSFEACPTLLPDGVQLTDGLELRIKLVSFDKAKDTWSMSFEEKVVEMKERKSKGNELFKAGRIKLAMKSYERAISFFEYSTSELSLELKKEVNILLVQCQLNMAACYEKQDSTEKVLHHCKLALDIEPANIKALYRRGNAYLKIDDYYKAESDLKYALEIDAKNVEVRRKLRELAEKRRKQDAQDRKLFTNMFSRLHKLEEREKAAEQAKEGVEVETAGATDQNGVSTMEEDS